MMNRAFSNRYCSYSALVLCPFSALQLIHRMTTLLTTYPSSGVDRSSDGLRPSLSRPAPVANTSARSQLGHRPFAGNSARAAARSIPNGMPFVTLRSFAARTALWTHTPFGFACRQARLQGELRSGFARRLHAATASSQAQHRPLLRYRSVPPHFLHGLPVNRSADI